MALVLDGSAGISGVDGTASNPAIEGTDSNTGIFYPAADTVAIGTGGTERLRVDSSGNVGVGNTSPASYNGSADNLVIGSSGSNGMTIVSGTTGAGYIMFADGTVGQQAYEGQITYDHASNFMAFNTSGTERARIDSSGNVGIGTQSPAVRLSLSTSTTGNVTAQQWTDGVTDTGYLGIRSGGGVGIWAGGFLAFGSGSGTFTERGRFTSGGNFKVSNGNYIDGNDYNIYLKSFLNPVNTLFRFTEKFYNADLGGTADPSRGYVRLCEAYSSGGFVDKSYFIGQIIYNRGNGGAIPVSSAVQVFVSSAYDRNTAGGVNFGDITIEIVRFTAGGVAYLGIRFNANQSSAGVQVIGVSSSGVAPAVITDGSTSSVTVLKTLPTAT